ncbi:hypothetical protein JW905_17065 [bacterium]|nr:hypothetical protein [candidate division CSSED10-310 bacterium]
MAVVTAMRFGPTSGAICVDRESWHVWRRKTFFSDRLYLPIPEDLADAHGVELVYGGVGHPPFHQEVMERATELLRASMEAGVTLVDPLARVVLEAFSEVRRRRVDDRLRFLFGFDSHDFLGGAYEREGRECAISQGGVKSRAGAIIQGKERLGYAPLTIPLEACIIGVDRTFGFNAFVIKDEEGVVSFQSCGFEALGQGRTVAAARFAKHLNRRFVDQRRDGPGAAEGWMVLLEATLEAYDHFGQVGGGIRGLELRADGHSRMERVRMLGDDRARLAMEVLRAVKEDQLSRPRGKELVEKLLDKTTETDVVEATLFDECGDRLVLEKILRGYKVDSRPLPAGRGTLAWLPVKTAVEGGRQ